MQRTEPELPTLHTGVTLLDSAERTVGALQSLVLDHLLLEGGDAVWVDAHGNGTTQPMARLAPSRRLLDRIRIARAFTPRQHQSLLRDLTDEITDETALIVLPAFDALYRSDDLGRRERERFLADGVAVLSDVANEHGVPILITRQRSDRFTEPVVKTAADVVTCELTGLGPRFSGDEFETLVYPITDGLVQTTFAFWSRVLSDRHPAVAALESTPNTGVSVRGTN